MAIALLASLFLLGIDAKPVVQTWNLRKVYRTGGSQLMRALTALLCLNGVYKEYLKEKGDRARSTKKELKRKIEYLEQQLTDREKIIIDLQEKLLSVSQNRL